MNIPAVQKIRIGSYVSSLYLNDYASTFRERVEETDGERCGPCRDRGADCQTQCGFEPTAVRDSVRHPQEAMGAGLRLRYGFGMQAATIGSGAEFNGSKEAEWI